MVNISQVTSYTFLEPPGASTNRQQNFSSNGFGQGPQRGPGGVQSVQSVQNNQFGQRPGTGGGYPPMFCVQLRVGGREFIGEGPTAQVRW